MNKSKLIAIFILSLQQTYNVQAMEEHASNCIHLSAITNTMAAIRMAGMIEPDSSAAIESFLKLGGTVAFDKNNQSYILTTPIGSTITYTESSTPKFIKKVYPILAFRITDPRYPDRYNTNYPNAKTIKQIKLYANNTSLTLYTPPSGCGSHGVVLKKNDTEKEVTLRSNQSQQMVYQYGGYYMTKDDGIDITEIAQLM